MSGGAGKNPMGPSTPPAPHWLRWNPAQPPGNSVTGPLFPEEAPVYFFATWGFPMAAITKYHQLGGSQQQNSILSQFWRPEAYICVTGRKPGCWQACLSQDSLFLAFPSALRLPACPGLCLHHSNLCLLPGSQSLLLSVVCLVTLLLTRGGFLRPTQIIQDHLFT